MIALKKKKRDDSLFDISIYAMHGGTVQEAAKAAGWTEAINDKEMQGFVVSTGRNYYIWLSKCTMRLFMHEFSHLVHAIFKEHGVTVSLDHDEIDVRWRSELAEFIWEFCKH